MNTELFKVLLIADSIICNIPTCYLIILPNIFVHKYKFYSLIDDLKSIKGKVYIEKQDYILHMWPTCLKVNTKNRIKCHEKR